MKIIIVSPYFPPHVGGAENYAFHIAKGLMGKKYEVVIMTSNHANTGYITDTVEGMNVYRLPIWFTLSKSPFHFFWIFYLVHIFRKEKPAVVIAHTPVPFLADVAVLAAKILKIPFVLTYHNDLVKENAGLSVLLELYYATFGKLLLSLSNKIITTSTYYVKQSPYLRPYATKTVIIPPGIAIEQFSGKPVQQPVLLQKAQQRKVILFVGTMDTWHSHKGLTYLLDAVAIAAKKIPHITLFAVGKGNNIPFFKQYAKEKYIDDNVIFTGFVSDDDLVSYYKQADVIVLPSTNNSEGFGMILLEAGACSKPVIATRVGGIPAVIKDLQSGLLVAPKNATDLAKAIIQILSDDVLATKMGKKGYKKVTEVYLWEHQVAKTDTLIQQL